MERIVAAGVNAKALSTYLGHANINITLDLYGEGLTSEIRRGTGSN